ncbi:hypothetical protein [Aeromonas sp. CA23]|uniref:hypothetical protein n=1 Tax=Aeromonas sp. CA23 TaxID=2033032 RepID=UPI0020A3B51B|nr:hypothetical protein [Aeromonas sp. CA23]
MQALQAAAEVIASAIENQGPREWRPKGTSGEVLRRYFSVSAGIGGRLGESSQRLSTWLHELDQQVHFWAGEPDLT